MILCLNIAGGAGCLLGALYGYNRNRKPFPFAVRGTGTFFIISGTFLGKSHVYFSTDHFLFVYFSDN